MLEGARYDATTRGFVRRDFPGGPEMVLIPPRTFTMGIPEKENRWEKTWVIDKEPVPYSR